MKNKKVTYLLTLLVLVIWLIVFYRIFVATSDDSVAPVLKSMPPKHDVIAGCSTFTLTKDYSDPFLKHKIGNKPATKTENVNTHLPAAVDPAPVKLKKMQPWPSFAFFGMIAGSEKKLGLVKIGGEEHIVMPGARIDSLTIELIHKDSIIVSLKNEKRTFYYK